MKLVLFFYKLTLIYTTFSCYQITCKQSSLKHLVVKRSSIDNYFGKDILKSNFINKLDELQTKLIDNNIEDCMPGSLFYNGSCYYFSRDIEKLTWLRAEKFCRKIPLNTSLLVIQNNKEFDFIKKQILRIKQFEQYAEQLVYNIGFNYSFGEWRWLNTNQTFSSLNATQLNLTNYWSDWRNSLGKCGSLVVLENNQVILRSTPCARTNERFICTYDLNACYGNQACGPYGKCINLFRGFTCKCTTIFKEGKYCDQWSSKALQAAAAICILVIVILYLILTGKTVRSLKRKIFNLNGKTTLKDLSLDSNIKRKKRTFRSILKNNCRKVFSNTFILVLMTSLTLLQIILIHIFKMSYKRSLVSYRNNSTMIQHVCTQLESGIFSEEMLYLIISFPTFILLIFFNRSKRFTNFIMSKYRLFFDSKVFKEKKREQKERQRVRLEEELSKLRKCERCWRKTNDSCMCKFLCWAFCCGCCAESNKTKHGCIGDCLGQSDFCKALKALKCLFSFMMCCTFWKGLVRYSSEKRKLAKRRQKKENDDNDDNGDDDDHVSDDDVAQTTDVISSSIPSYRFPQPIKPFSTTNRLLSVAIYVAYTYDILNIFMTLYSSYMVLPIVSVAKDRKGVLVDFLIQILQVIVIGFKFYPILAIADMDPRIWTYLLGFLNVLFIWSIKVIKKGFCSKTEAFVRFAIEKLGDEFNRTKVFTNDRLNLDFNLTSTSDLTEKYLNVIKDKLPSLFDSEFKYDRQEPSSTPLPMLPLMQTNSTRFSFRKKFSNKTNNVITKILDDFEQDENDFWISLRNFLENLPLYLSLSYLVARYLMCVIDTLIRMCLRSSMLCKLPIKTVDNQLESRKILIKTIQKTHQKDESFNKQASQESLCLEEQENYRFKQLQITNHNYLYTRQLIKNYVKSNQAPQATHKLRNLSKTLEIFHKIYQPIKHLRFSKSYVNTYTVAFMVVYFFTVFLLRMSNIFGDWFVKGMDFVYRFIFRNINSTFSFEDHNIFTEFSIACLLTSVITIVQLLCSIRSFKEYVMWLHRGGRYARNDRNRYERINLRKLHQDQSEINTMMTSHSMHFPGYLIAHLVYGYFLLFIALFGLILLGKLLWYLPQTFDLAIQIFLPIIIMILLKLVGMKFLTKAVFLRESSERITNLTPYYTASYFNFFFDCFLGLVACLNRVWQTTVISLIYLPRLDITIFNQQNDLIMKQLDKGHLAYINFVHMEHYYNNPVLNGFCDILIETLFQSYILESQLNKRAGVDFSKEDCVKFSRFISQVSRNDAQNINEVDVLELDSSPKTIISSSATFGVALKRTDTPSESRKFNFDDVKGSSFQYESYRRLCNIFKLYYLLKTHPELRKYTRGNIEKRRERLNQKDLFVQEAIKKKKMSQKVKEFLASIHQGPKNLKKSVN